MKKSLITIASSFFAVTLNALATTITATGGTGGAVFVTSTAELLTASNSSIRAGSISGDVFTTFAALDSSPISISTVNNALFFGKWAGDTSDISAAAIAFNSQQVWFEVSVDLGGGVTGVGYFSGNQVFPVNNNGVGDNIDINSTSLSLINTTLSTDGSAAYNGTSNQIVIGVVPEPSVALLGVLSLLGILRRKR